MILVFYILIIVALILAFSFRNLINAFWYSLKIPGPPALPLLGNGLLFINKSPSEFASVLDVLYTKYGKFVRIWLGPELHVFISEPNDVEMVLSSQKLIDKSDSYSFIRPWLGDGLLLSTGKKWYARRKAITPTFHFKILEQFVKVFNKQSDILVGQLKEVAQKGGSVDMYPLISLFTLDVVCESAMGISANAQSNSESKYVRAVKELSQITFMRMFDYILRFDFFFAFSSHYSSQKRALDTVHTFTDSVIIQRRGELLAHRHNTMKDENSDEEVGIKKKMGLLDVLLKSEINGQPLSNMEIREEVDTFMFEGHDTTTSAICFILFNLAKYPAVQQKVVEEIRRVVNDDFTEPITLAQLNEMHYTELVIKETLRLYPSVPLLARKIAQNTEINGKIIPKGTNLLISPYMMGRDPDTYTNPEDFNPERFDVLTTADVTNPYSYVPFSAGPRNCIGQKFAVLELKSLVFKMLKNFELKLPENHEDPVLVAALILRPQHGMPLKIENRVFQ